MYTFAMTTRAAPAFVSASRGPARPPRQTPGISHILHGPRLQPKLKVGAVNDPAEAEADRMAEQVMRMPGPEIAGGSPAISTHSGAAPVRRLCGGCEEELNRKPATDRVQRMSNAEGTGTDEEEIVQAKAQPGQDVSLSPASESAIRSLGSGTRLPPSETAFFQPRFGRSFENIRVHTGSNADHAARSVNARAFALGNDIAFARGEYRPGSPKGRSLLAHELTHTVQQSAGPQAVQRGDAGIFGGKCCNQSPDGDEWALVGDGQWKRLKSGECTGTLEDCDGMTCGGGFYHVDNMTTGTCITPRVDDDYYRPRRWTPTSQGKEAMSPEDAGSKEGNTPPGYEYDNAEGEKTEGEKDKTQKDGAPPQDGGGGSGTKTFALTFDDGPHAAELGKGTNRTEAVLDTMKAKGLTGKGAFFIQTGVSHRGASPVGRTLVERMHNEGYTVGIHTGGSKDHESHRAAEQAGRLESELTSAKGYIKERTGSDPTFVRAPYGLGRNDPKIKAIYSKLSLTHLFWDIDGDHKYGSLDDLKNNFDSGLAALKQSPPGSYVPKTASNKIVILYHDIRATTSKHIGDMIDYIRSKVPGASFDKP